MKSKKLFVLMTIASILVLNLCKDTSNLKKLSSGKEINAEKIQQTVQKVISNKEKDLSNSEAKNLLLSTHSNKLNSRVNTIGNSSNNKSQTSSTPINFYPVNYVKKLSPAGKAALEAQESGDYEYLALLNAGYETPKITTSVISHYDTNVTGPKKIQHLWSPITPSQDSALWTNVEFHKYGNNVLENHKFNTRAKFTMDKFGDTIVHAPNDSGMRIIKRTPTITSFSTFLGIGDDETLF